MTGNGSLAPATGLCRSGPTQPVLGEEDVVEVGDGHQHPSASRRPDGRPGPFREPEVSPRGRPREAQPPRTSPPPSVCAMRRANSLCWLGAPGRSSRAPPARCLGCGRSPAAPPGNSPRPYQAPGGFNGRVGPLQDDVRAAGRAPKPAPTTLCFVVIRGRWRQTFPLIGLRFPPGR